MSDILLTTKLFIPPPPASLLPRQRLLDQLHRGLGLENRLILVCAPAGYGKTTLVAGWLRGTRPGPDAPGPSVEAPGTAAAWLSLDSGDNDPVQFSSYLAAALKRALPGREGSLPALLQSPQPVHTQAMFSTLINDLAAENQSILIILDDYQVIQNPSIHEGLVFFLDHLPPGVHVLITSRSDPPFPLHRYRARGQVVEIRAADLRFTPQEIPQLIHDLTGYAAAPDETEILSERTEGWAAGLQMAAIALQSHLSIQGKPDAGGFIHAFANSRRYILDYLAEEVFNAQPRHVQRFLLTTSLLDRFSAPLCEALRLYELEMDPMGGAPGSQEILEALVRSNLFLIPLDAQGEWFRYHHLFADLLRLRLKGASAGQISAPELHRRASQWFETNGWFAEATQHALDAGDFDRAAGLVERHTVRLFSQSELNRLVRWIQQLPGEVSDRHPWLKLYHAWAYAFAGKLSEAEELVRQAETAISAGVFPPDEQEKLNAELAGLRGLLAITTGRVEDALALAEIPASAFPPESAFAYCAVLWACGYAWRQRGELQRARAAFEEMLSLSRKGGFLWTAITASVDLGAVLRQLGQLHRAEGVYRQALEEAARAGAGNFGFLGRLESFLAQTLYDQNELDEARRFALASIEHNRLWQNPNHTAHAHLVHSKIAQALGDQAAAEDALGRAEEIAARAQIVPTLQAAVELARVRSWLNRGDFAAAGNWAKRRAGAGSVHRIYDEAGEQIELALARVQLGSGKKEDALQRLEGLEAAARQMERNSALIEILVVKAQVAAGREAAFDALGSALALGLPEGFVRTFLDEGQAVRELLKAYRASFLPDTEMRIHIDRLIGLMSVPAVDDPEGDQARPSILTGREMEIIGWMAQGLANAEIGKKLYISPGTVKAHSASIYRKLEAANRTEAIARAKDLGLI